MELNSDNVVGNVYITTDYDKFKKLDVNRDIDHVERIRRSIAERYVPTPIIVNEKLEVIDGQNRLEAIKSLGLPLRYTIVPGLGIEDVRAMNQGAKNWGGKDFVKSYAKEGKEAYVLYEKFCEKYPDFPFSIAEVFLRQSSTNDSTTSRHKGSYYNTVQRGIFKIKDFERSCQLADMVMQYKGLDNNATPIYKRKPFVVAIVKLARLSNFDNDEIVRKIKQFPRSFVPCVNSTDYIRMLEEIVNYRRRTNKIRFNV